MPFVPDSIEEPKRSRFIPDEPQVQPHGPSGESRLSLEDVQTKRIRETREALQDVGHGGTTLLRNALNLIPRSKKPLTLQDIASGKKEGDAKPGFGDLLTPSAVNKDSGAVQVGKFFDPVAWEIGAGVSKALPYAKVLGAGGPAAVKAILKNLTSGAASGGAIGALSDESDAAAGAGYGAAANAILPPVVGAAVRAPAAIWSMIHPNVGQLAARAAGDKTEAVAQAIMAARSGVPGTKLTAGQASVPANSAEFAALQELVAGKDPSKYVGAGGVEGQQQAARRAAIQSVGGTPEQLASAVHARTVESAANYGEAFANAVKRDKTLRELWKNPYFKDEVGEAAKLMRAKGLKLTKNYTEFLHYVKEGLDARLANVGQPGSPAISKATQHALLDVKQRLLGWLEENNPAYEAARAAHQAASVPINRMELGQEFAGKLTTASGKESPSGFAGAVRKAGVDTDVTGAPRIEALTPSQRKVIDAITSDLSRDAAWKKLAASGRDSLEDRIQSFELPPPGIFQPFVSAARGWFNRATGHVTDRGLKELSALMRDDPQKLAQMMLSFSPSQRKVVDAMIQRYTAGPVGGVISGVSQE